MKNNIMKYFSPLFPFILGWGLLLFSDNLNSISFTNGVLQLLLFALIVCLPTWRTGRMSYVDIGWPWGVALIGIITWLYGEGDSIRIATISILYILIGSRMGMGALKMWRLGMLKIEFPRYEYQKKRWKKAGKNNTMLAMQIDGILQGLANASFLAMPALIIATNSNTTISMLEIVGVFIWLGAFVMESIADMQKISFLKKMKASGEKNKVCNVGLWKYTRHPNYFAEWMVWNGLIIASIPSWILLNNTEPMTIWILLGLGLLFTSRMMYTTLVYHTGAIPSEYYSLKKRSDYKTYQETTNIFFPGPKK
jgi:steroid 5-alpha reductase family enzyme